MSLNKEYHSYWSWLYNKRYQDCPVNNESKIITDFFNRRTSIYYRRKCYCDYYSFNFDDFVKYLTESNLKFGYIRIFDKNNSNYFRYTLPIEINLIHKLCPVEIKFKRKLSGFIGTVYFHLRIIVDCKNNSDPNCRPDVNNLKRIEYYNDLMEEIDKQLDDIKQNIEITSTHDDEVSSDFDSEFERENCHLIKTNTRNNNNKLINKNTWYFKRVIDRIKDLPNPVFTKLDLE